MNCEEVQRELSTYLDQELPAEVRVAMQDHFHACEMCATLLDDTRDIVLALGDERLVDVPPGYSTRLYRKLKNQVRSTRSSFRLARYHRKFLWGSQMTWSIWARI